MHIAKVEGSGFQKKLDSDQTEILEETGTNLLYVPLENFLTRSFEKVY